MSLESHLGPEPLKCAESVILDHLLGSKSIRQYVNPWDDLEELGGACVVGRTGPASLTSVIQHEAGWLDGNHVPGSAN